MFGEDDAHANKENALIIAYEACRTDLLMEFVSYVAMVEFESRKDMVAIFGAVVRIEDNGQMPGVQYIVEHDSIMRMLFDGWVDGVPGGWVGCPVGRWEQGALCRTVLLNKILRGRLGRVVRVQGLERHRACR